MPADEISIEPLAADPTPTDLDDLAHLLSAAVQAGAAVSFLSPLSHQHARAWWQSTLAALHRRAVVLVARDRASRRIVGTAQLQPAWAPNQPHRAEVCKVIVHPDVQRRGVARRLMGAIEDAARAGGFTLLTLDARADGPADRLYRALGWTFIGRIPGFALDPDGRTLHDDALFYKPVAPARNTGPVPAPPHRLHHVAVICSDYQRSRDFYVRILGLRIVRESFRPDRRSHKLDLALAGGVQIELFSFPDPPPRLTRPEACGLRHLALAVANIDAELSSLASFGVAAEPVRTDGHTGRRFTFIRDPDDLPIELYEQP